MTEGRGTIQRTPRTFETGERKTGGVRLPYLPGLDGLRALAIIAVLLYHAELRWTQAASSASRSFSLSAVT